MKLFHKTAQRLIPGSGIWMLGFVKARIADQYVPPDRALVYYSTSSISSTCNATSGERRKHLPIISVAHCCCLIAPQIILTFVVGKRAC